MTTPTSRHSSGSSHAASRKAAPMNSTSSSRSPASHASGTDLASWKALTELSRQQLGVVSEGSSAIYRGSEALRKIQQEAAHEASVRHAQAAKKLLSPCEPADVLALQTELMRSNMQSATHYWEQFMVVALQTQRDMMLSVGHLFEGESGSGMNSALKAFQATIPPMATSFFVHNPSDASEPH